MEVLPASAEVLEFLVASGDDGIRARVAWIRETVLDIVPDADALAIWFADEDLTLFLGRPPDAPSRAGASPENRSSLALRFATPRRTIAVVTAYSKHADAFTGRVDQVERALGAVLGASVLDQDPHLLSHRHAEDSPAQVRARRTIDTAVGLLMGTAGLGVDDAEDWLEHTARTSDRTILAVASQVVTAHDMPVDPSPHPRE